MGMTITRFYEKIVLPPLWDPTPITDAGPDIPDQFIKEYKVFAEEWASGIKARNLSLPTHEAVKGNLVKGPNGPSVMTSHYDAVAVYEDKVLNKWLKTLASLTGTK
jgi:hypothetical protein